MKGPCNNCDNCLHPKTQFEGKEYIIKTLNAILTVKEKFKADHIACFLAGIKNNVIKSYKHNLLEEFGSGKDKDNKFWGAVIRQALIARLIEKEIENYGLLKLTQKGHEFIKNPKSLILSEDHEYNDQDDDDEIVTAGSKTGAVDEELFHILKNLRKKISKQLKLPPFVIFQDPSLEDMAIQYPVTIDELQNITGVGMGKAKRYGKEFIDLIKKYVEEKEIIRPQDMIVKSIINKSGLKVYIIQSIDRKISLDDIADAKNLNMNDLLDEVEAIVNSGTKLNLDYYIDCVLDKEHQKEIYQYFREDAETESIEEALMELGEDEYTEEDIRLMRIKFMSEMGN
jgi:ATP-dependent DNA helicase RecQ